MHDENSERGGCDHSLTKKEYIRLILVAAAAFLVYANTMLNGFAWDDKLILAAYNWENKSLLSVFGTLDVAKDVDITPYYRPLTYLSFMLEYRLHGSNPAYMHLVNTLLHAAISALVCLMAWSLSRSGTVSLVAGLLFAVHPLNSEGVAFLSGGRNTMLAACFAISAFLLHVRRRRGGGPLCLAASVLLLAAALFSKETSLAILLVIACWELRESGFRAGNALKSGAAAFFWYAIPLLIYVLMRSYVMLNAGVATEILPGLFSRLAQNIYILPRYLLTVLWPPVGTITYVIPDNLAGVAPFLAASWLAIFGALWWLLFRRRSAVARFGLAWFVLFWLPSSGIIPFPSAPMADRYLYLPAIGLWIVAADTVSGCFGAISYRRFALAAAGIVFALLAGFTVKRNMVWKNDITLFSDYVRQYPNEAMGHHNLGTAYMDLANDFARADQEFMRVLMINPYFSRVHTQMGYIRLKGGDLEGALLHYNAAVEHDPLDSEALFNRGQVLEMMGRTAEALAEYRRFLAVPNRELNRLRPEVLAKVAELERMEGGKIGQ